MEQYKRALKLLRKWKRDGDPTARKILHIDQLMVEAYGQVFGRGAAADADSEQQLDARQTTDDALRFVHNLTSSVFLNWISNIVEQLRGTVSLSRCTRHFFFVFPQSLTSPSYPIAIWDTRADYMAYFIFSSEVLEQMPALTSAATVPEFSLDHVLARPLPNPSGLVLEFGVAGGKSLRRICASSAVRGKCWWQREHAY